MDPQRQKKRGKTDSEAHKEPVQSVPEESTERLEIERKLILRLKEDADAYTEFIVYYHPKIFGFLFNHLGDEELVNELTNETFVRAWNGFKRFEWRGVSPGGYFFRTAKNLLVAHWEKAAKDNKVSCDLGETDIEGGERPDHKFFQGEAKSLLWSYVEKLEESQCIVLSLHYGSELKVREIAHSLGMKEPTVKSHLQRGRRRLLKMFLAEGLDPEEFSDLYEVVQQAIWNDSGFTIVEGKVLESSEE